MCSQTPLYVHRLNTETSLLWTVCFVPGERKPNIFPITIQPALYKHPVTMDTFFYSPFSVHINGVWLYYKLVNI